MISIAYAQEAAQQPNPIMSMVPLIAVFFIFYFLMIRPQKKRMEEEKKFILSLDKGQEVYTKSGLIGKIYGLTDKVVTLEVEDGHKVKYLRSQIAGSTAELFKEKEAPKK